MDGLPHITNTVVVVPVASNAFQCMHSREQGTCHTCASLPQHAQPSSRKYTNPEAQSTPTFCKRCEALGTCTAVAKRRLRFICVRGSQHRFIQIAAGYIIVGAVGCR
jgi:hypothetical protein